MTQTAPRASLLLSVAGRLPQLIAQADHLAQMVDGLERAAPSAEMQKGDLARACRWSDSAEAALKAAEDLIALEPATNLGEAAVQLMLATARAEIVSIECLDEERRAEECAALIRLLRSALPQVASAAGIDLEAFGLAHYADRRVDPFYRGAANAATAAADPAGLGPGLDAQMLRDALASLRQPRTASGA